MEAVKIILESGVLGAVAVLSLGAAWRLYRDRQEAERRHATELAKLNAEHVLATRELRDQHGVEMATLRDRLVTKAESWMAKYYDLATAIRETVERLGGKL